MTTGAAATTAAPPGRGDRAGDRWWLPGTLVGLGTAVAGWLVTVAWRAYEAGGCNDPGAKFECLGETLVAVALAVVLGPVLLWLAYRKAGVRRPLLSVVVAVAVAFVLQAAPELISQVRLLAGVDRPPAPWPAAGVAAVLGLASLGGGLALQGPRRLVRAGAAALGVAGMVASVLVLAGPADRAELRLDLAGAEVPLLVADGWQPYGPYVDDGGELSYDVVPVGWPGYGFEGVSIDVRRSTETFGDTCSFQVCTTSGDITHELPEGGGGLTAWRVVDGVLVTAQTVGDRTHVPALDPVDALRGMSEIGVEEWLARTFDDR